MRFPRPTVRPLAPVLRWRRSQQPGLVQGRQQGSGDRCPCRNGASGREQFRGGDVTDCAADQTARMPLLTLRWPDDGRLFIFAIFFPLVIDFARPSQPSRRAIPTPTTHRAAENVSINLKSWRCAVKYSERTLALLTPPVSRCRSGRIGWHN